MNTPRTRERRRDKTSTNKLKFYQDKDLVTFFKFNLMVIRKSVCS